MDRNVSIAEKLARARLRTFEAAGARAPLAGTRRLPRDGAALALGPALVQAGRWLRRARQRGFSRRRLGAPGRA